ncbi:MAG: hypothetical protein JWM56_760 [Candidatus Peribacteria bacterium]|nr:hypothetical protein [Candidatus Peribacteria bacterium]
MKSLAHILRSDARNSQVIRFIFTGGTGAVIEFVFLYFLVEFFGIPKAIAGTYSLVPSVIYTFFMNKYFTFQSRDGHHGSQAIKFILVYAIAIVFNIAIYSALVWLGVLYPLAKAIAIGIVAVWNYFLSHGFIFKTSAVQE